MTEDYPSHEVVAPFMRAWLRALHEWEWSGPGVLDGNLRVLGVYSNADWQHSPVPPWRLVVEWQRDGCPDPARWIEASLTALRRRQRSYDLAG